MGDVPVEERPPLSDVEFDPFVAGLDYPIYVVTTADGRTKAGCLAGFVSQVSINPPRLLVCLSVKNHTYRTATQGRALAVHVLGVHQRGLAELFGSHSGDDLDKFAACAWETGPFDVPVLSQCPRLLVGRIISRVPLGDHEGFLIEPVEVRSTPGPTLTFQSVQDLSPGHEA